MKFGMSLSYLSLNFNYSCSVCSYILVELQPLSSDAKSNVKIEEKVMEDNIKKSEKLIVY